LIKNFGNKETEKLYITGKSAKFPYSIIKVSLRKLDYLNSANSLKDLASPAGNKLETLKGDLKEK